MVQKFLDYIAIERNYSPCTVDAYRDDIRDFCDFLGWAPEDYNPAEVSEADIRAWMIHMMDESHNSAKSVKRRLAALRSFYKYMLRVGLIEKDITRRIISPKVDKPLPVFFRESEMERATMFDDAADDYESVRSCLIIQMLYQTGMRQAEMLGLKDADVDTVQGQVRIFGKRRKERVVPIGEKLCLYIDKYRTYRDAYLSTQDPLSPITNPLSFFPGLTKDKLYEIVHHRMGEVSTQKKLSPHVLRHTFATTMLNNGADIRTIQTLLGHASLAATQIYTHTTFDQIREAYNNAHPRGKNKPTGR